jgi:hypothetical protein
MGVVAVSIQRQERIPGPVGCPVGPFAHTIGVDVKVHAIIGAAEIEGMFTIEVHAASADHSS